MSRRSERQYQRRRDIRTLIEREQGTIRKDAPFRFVLVYPSTYRVALSSLGYQTLYRLLNEMRGVSCERAVLSFSARDERGNTPLRTLEFERPVGEASAIGVSVATEAEVGLAARALLRAGIPPLEAERRGRGFPPVIMGGPLTYADPSPLCALADIVICGEAEGALTDLAAVMQRGAGREELLGACDSIEGALVASERGESTGRCPRRFAIAEGAWLPAFSAVIAPGAEFGGMFLVEPARGCPRRCAFCVMEARTFRAVAQEQVLARVPDHARRVGLVGAALGDHREIRGIIEALVGSGREVSLSSMRADKLDDEMLALLRRGGLRSLTVAADGASERLRRMVRKGISAGDLIRAAELAARHKLRSVKLYAMVGLPTEEDEDIEELCRLAAEMRKSVAVSLALSTFVPKARTSLADAPFAPRDVIKRRLDLIRSKLGGKVEIRAVSYREAWIENTVAHGGFRAGQAAVDVAEAGCTYRAWRRAAEHHGLPGAGN